jgi:hypothetical protein
MGRSRRVRKKSRPVSKIRRALRHKRVQRGGDLRRWHIYIYSRNGTIYSVEQVWDQDDIEGLKAFYTDRAIQFGYFNENEELNYIVDHYNKHLIIQRQQDLNNPDANNNNNNNSNNGAGVAPLNPFDNNDLNVGPLNPFDNNPFDNNGPNVVPLNPFDAAFEESLQQAPPAAAAATPLVNTDPENTNNSNNSDPSVNVASGVRSTNNFNDEPTASVEGGRKRRRRRRKTKKSTGRRNSKTRKSRK